MIRNPVTKTLSVLVALCLVASGCDDRAPTGGSVLVSDLKVNLGPLKVKLDRDNDPADCTQPRPADIGCTTLCKPCVTWICVDGQWERFRIETPDLCEPREPTDPGPFGCPRDETGFCPAECSFCY